MIAIEVRLSLSIRSTEVVSLRTYVCIDVIDVLEVEQVVNSDRSQGCNWICALDRLELIGNDQCFSCCKFMHDKKIVSDDEGDLRCN